MPIKDIDRQRRIREARQVKRELSPDSILKAKFPEATLAFMLKHVKGETSQTSHETTGEITVVCVSALPSVQILYDALATLTASGFAGWIPVTSAPGQDFVERVMFSSWSIELQVSDELKAQARFADAVAVCKATYKVPFSLGKRDFVVLADEHEADAFVIESEADYDD